MTKHDGPVLVIGATGQQGGAVARELLTRGRAVRALTRSSDSVAARKLVEQGANLVYGDLDDPVSIRHAMAGAQAVFSVQTHRTGAGVQDEVRQGLVVAEAAKDVGVAQAVYSSVDGAERNSGVPHFESKWAIEQHLGALGVPTTVLRPTMFMENFAAHARPQVIDGTLLVRLPLRSGASLQMVACADIGMFAADAFERPEDYIGTAVALAGDELTGPQIAEAFQGVAGIPARFDPQPVDEIRAFSEDMALMFEWISDFGYDQVDIPQLRRQQPKLRTLRSWLRATGWQAAVAA